MLNRQFSLPSGTVNGIPLVSVVMSVYNGGYYLPEAVESILRQSLGDFEFIIIDDGSVDGSSDVLAAYAASDSRIRLYSQSNAGLYNALNKGCKLAIGKYIARMDADDISFPHRLQTQAGFMESNPGIGVCGSWAEALADKKTYVVHRPANPDDINAGLLFDSCIIHSSAMMRRELMLENNISYRYDQAEDYDLWVQFSQYSKLANIPAALLHYRQHADQASDVNKKRMHEVGLIVRKEQLRALGLVPQESELILHQSICLCQHERSADYVRRAEDWLLNIRQANLSERVYSDHSLSHILALNWLRICRSNLPGNYYALKRLMMSPLTRLVSPGQLCDAISAATEIVVKRLRIGRARVLLTCSGSASQGGAKDA